MLCESRDVTIILNITKHNPQYLTRFQELLSLFSTSFHVLLYKCMLCTQTQSTVRKVQHSSAKTEKPAKNIKTFLFTVCLITPENEMKTTNIHITILKEKI